MEYPAQKQSLQALSNVDIFGLNPREHKGKTRCSARKNIRGERKAMRCLKIACVFCLMSVLSAVGLSAQEKTANAKTPYRVPKTELKIAVDGRLDEEAWNGALKFDLKYETDPGENIPALVKTEVMVIHDDKNIYFGFRCDDPDPSAIRSWYADRDNLFMDDLVNVNLDTFNDERRNFFFGANALGIQRDGIETPSYTDQSWDAIWDSSGRIADTGYFIEMAIPFSSLQFQRVEGPQIWGLDISRWYQRSVLHRLGLVPLDRNNNSYQNQFLKIEGFEGITPGKNLEFNPTVTSSRTDERESLPKGAFKPLSRQTEAGISAKWGIARNFTVSAAVNPDFSQVEADAQQLDINQPFALFFMEKRPFFVEGMDFFISSLNVVYTRTMRNPEWGIKLTGKEGANTFGAYMVQDGLTNLIFPGSQGSRQTSLPMDSLAGVFRYKRDLGQRYTVGALITDREGEGYYNRLAGLDGVFRFNDTNTFKFQVLGSRTLYPDSVAADFEQPADAFGDRAIDLSYRYQSRNLNIFSGYSDVGKNFRTDLGFMPQVDYRQFRTAASYQWVHSRGWWSVIQAGGGYFRSTDQGGNLLNENGQLTFFFRGAMQSFFNMILNKSRESYAGKTYGMTGGQMFFMFQPASGVVVGFNGDIGGKIDYANARPGRQARLASEAMLNAWRNIRIGVNHEYARMTVGGERLYTANILQGSFIYHFNSRTFFRSILQYVDYRYNVANYTFRIDPKFRHFFTQLLFSYKINPRTVLFLGYSDNAQGNQDYGLTRSDRTFFLKIGYAWQL